MYVYEKDCLREVGDILSLNGNFSPLSFTEYEGRFSFTTYLVDKGVTSSFQGDIINIFSLPLRFRKWSLNALKGVGGEASILLDSLLFDRKDYEAIALDVFQEAGLIYCLSASGFIYQAYNRFNSWFLEDF